MKNEMLQIIQINNMLDLAHIPQAPSTAMRVRYVLENFLKTTEESKHGRIQETLSVVSSNVSNTNSANEPDPGYRLA